MSNEMLNMGLLAAMFLGLFGIAELLYYKFKLKVEITRKIVHFATGLITLLFPVMLKDQRSVLLLCGVFALIILASMRFKFLMSVNGIDRRSYGSISYPFAVYGSYLVYDHYTHTAAGIYRPCIYFYLPILVLAICDPAAALVGKKYPVWKYSIGKDTKTVIGSSVFFISSFLMSASLLFYFSGYRSRTFANALFISGVATLAEAISGKGIDNITIPASVIIVLLLLI